MPSANRYVEAFKENVNKVGIASVVALSAALLTPLPLVAGLVLEAAYLLVVPDTKWYEARLSKRYDAEIEQRREKLKQELLPTLRPEMQERFRRLEETRRQIDAQAQEDKKWFREVLRKLDYLMDTFLRFAAKEAQFRNYLQSLRAEVHGERTSEKSSGLGWDSSPTNSRRADRSPGDVKRRPLRPEPSERVRPDAREAAAPLSAVDPNDRWTQQAVEEVQAHYTQEQEQIEKEMTAEQDADTQAVLAKRIDTLQRRQEFAGKIGKILTNLNHQLHLVEDTFGLINDEIRARSPEQVLADIEEVVVATDSMSSALEELAPYEQMADRAMSRTA
jgi:hypothetical protein